MCVCVGGGGGARHPTESLTVHSGPNRAVQRRKHRLRVSTTPERNLLLWGIQWHNRETAGG